MNSTPSAPYPPPTRDAFPQPGMPQPGMLQPGMLQPGVPQPGMPQPGMPQPGMPHPGMPQPGMPQPGMPQPGMPQPGMPQPGMPQPGMPQPGIPQPGMPQPGVPQPGKPQPGKPQPGKPQSRMPQPGVPSYGTLVPQSGASQDGWLSPNMICPPGLEYLIALDYLAVRQEEEPIELVAGFECPNKYHVMKANGQRLYCIQEESNICALLCLGPSRCCEFCVFDTSEREVLHMVRPYRCSSCCCCCCTQVLEVYSGEVLLGIVMEHRSSFLRPSFSIRDASGKTVLRIKGPWIKCCGTAKFQIRSADDVYRIGEIKKEWGGCCTETFTDADKFSLRFPIDLDVKIKAVLLGACILIDYLYFEECKCQWLFNCLEGCARVCSLIIELLVCCLPA
ncbi:hypothetical protein K0M31_005301 [Melipona bicolor]|uniref:Phospholipid scramblase n=1 Tax=Melipona bicolor TaxID=60889 RepID=A0AA40FV05_9HYME|nr:hypothetical protein K0M31_005301 [Melipona bicolor]